MNGVESVADVKGLTQMTAERAGSEPTGPLAANRKALSEALGEAGFVDLQGQWQENFEAFISRESFGVEVEDLTLGVISELISSVAEAFSADQGRAQNTQARVGPERAVKLLA